MLHNMCNMTFFVARRSSTPPGFADDETNTMRAKTALSKENFKTNSNNMLLLLLLHHFLFHICSCS